MRYYIIVDDDVYYFSFDERGMPSSGFSRARTVLFNSLKSDGLITNDIKDTKTKIQQQ